MKRFIQTVLATAAAAVVLQGCATVKPLAESVSEPDYNQRITITNPQYKTVPNALGYVLNLALPAAGAFAGMMYLPAVMVYDETSGAPATSDIGNAVLGGLAGLGVALEAGPERVVGHGGAQFPHGLAERDAGGGAVVHQVDVEAASAAHQPEHGPQIVRRVRERARALQFQRERPVGGQLHVEPPARDLGKNFARHVLAAGEQRVGAELHINPCAMVVERCPLVMAELAFQKP